MQVTPNLNDTVTLHDREGREYRSRVEGVEGAALTVARPLGLPRGESVGAGADWLLSWSVTGGIAVLPTQLIASYEENGLGLWSVTATGPSWVEQRRRFVRVPAFGRVVLEPRADTAERDAEPESVTGTLIDISEGALRCSVDRAHARHPTLDAEVIAHFHFGDLDLAVPGTVSSRRDGSRPAPVTQLIVVFDEPNADADALRKEIFAQQRRTLRRS